jgi:uncharacterized protein YcsI (UPF0317 family)
MHNKHPLLDSVATRHLIRRGAWQAHTSGLAPGHVQGNVVILPEALAGDFQRFCERNHKACPLLAVSGVGAATLPALGRDLDVRTDIPRYRVWRDGELSDEVTDIRSLWRDDFVTFVIGCSFTFEQALLRAGLPLRHMKAGRNVAMYRTRIPTDPAGPFSGPMVVSMRPFTPADARRAIQVTARFPEAHGAPVHMGDPRLLGIADITCPDYGDPIELRDGEVPVFWACGVTSQAALLAARPPLCITHAPGAMLVTDLHNDDSHNDHRAAGIASSAGLITHP